MPALYLRKTRITYDQIEVVSASNNQNLQYIDRDGKPVREVRLTQNKVETLEAWRTLTEAEAALFTHPIGDREELEGV